MNKYNFFIPGRLPGMNEVIDKARSNKYSSAQLKKAWTQRVADVVRMTFRTIKPLRIVWISFRWVEKNKRRDPDNLIVAKKFVLDGLVLAGMLKNDGWGEIAGFTDTWEVGEPGVWVSVKEV